MLKAGIVADDWKLPIFRKALDAAGYKYEEFKGPTPGVTTITVETDNLDKLTPIVKKMNSDARKSKMN